MEENHLKKRRSLFIVLTLSLTLIRPHPTFAAVSSQDLNQYIQQIGVSPQVLTNYLADYGLSLNDFTSIEDLKSSLGEPLNSQTLTKVLNDYGLTKDELIQLLKENGMTLNDYSFVNDLKSDLVLFTTKAELESLFNELGLTDQELTNLGNHLAKIDTEKITPQLNAIGQQLSHLSFDNPSDLSSKDTELLSTSFNQMLQLVQLEPLFYLEKNNQKQQISLNDLVNLGNLNGANLIIELYDLNGNLLADMTINPNTLNSDLIDKFSKIMSYFNIYLNGLAPNGGQLPNTATHTWDFLILGLFLLILGAGLLKRSFKKCTDG